MEMSKYCSDREGTIFPPKFEWAAQAWEKREDGGKQSTADRAQYAGPVRRLLLFFSMDNNHMRPDFPNLASPLSNEGRELPGRAR